MSIEDPNKNLPLENTAEEKEKEAEKDSIKAAVEKIQEKTEKEDMENQIASAAAEEEKKAKKHDIDFINEINKLGIDFNNLEETLKKATEGIGEVVDYGDDKKTMDATITKRETGLLSKLSSVYETILEYYPTVKLDNWEKEINVGSDKGKPSTVIQRQNRQPSGAERNEALIAEEQADRRRDILKRDKTYENNFNVIRVYLSWYKSKIDRDNKEGTRIVLGSDETDKIKKRLKEELDISRADDLANEYLNISNPVKKRELLEKVNEILNEAAFGDLPDSEKKSFLEEPYSIKNVESTIRQIFNLSEDTSKEAELPIFERSAFKKLVSKTFFNEQGEVATKDPYTIWLSTKAAQSMLRQGANEGIRPKIEGRQKELFNAAEEILKDGIVNDEKELEKLRKGIEKELGNFEHENKLYWETFNMFLEYIPKTNSANTLYKSFNIDHIEDREIPMVTAQILADPDEALLLVEAWQIKFRKKQKEIQNECLQKGLVNPDGTINLEGSPLMRKRYLEVDRIQKILADFRTKCDDTIIWEEKIKGKKVLPRFDKEFIDEEGDTEEVRKAKKEGRDRQKDEKEKEITEEKWEEYKNTHKPPNYDRLSEEDRRKFDEEFENDFRTEFNRDFKIGKACGEMLIRKIDQKVLKKWQDQYKQKITELLELTKTKEDLVLNDKKIQSLKKEIEGLYKKIVRLTNKVKAADIEITRLENARDDFKNPDEVKTQQFISEVDEDLTPLNKTHNFITTAGINPNDLEELLSSKNDKRPLFGHLRWFNKDNMAGGRVKKSIDAWFGIVVRARANFFIKDMIYNNFFSRRTSAFHAKYEQNMDKIRLLTEEINALQEEYDSSVPDIARRNEIAREQLAKNKQIEKLTKSSTWAKRKLSAADKGKQIYEGKRRKIANQVMEIVSERLRYVLPGEDGELFHYDENGEKVWNTKSLERKLGSLDLLKTQVEQSSKNISAALSIAEDRFEKFKKGPRLLGMDNATFARKLDEMDEEIRRLRAEKVEKEATKDRIIKAWSDTNAIIERWSTFITEFAGKAAVTNIERDAGPTIEFSSGAISKEFKVGTRRSVTAIDEEGWKEQEAREEEMIIEDTSEYLRQWSQRYAFDKDAVPSLNIDGFIAWNRDDITRISYAKMLPKLMNYLIEINSVETVGANGEITRTQPSEMMRASLLGSVKAFNIDMMKKDLSKVGAAA